MFYLFTYLIIYEQIDQSEMKLRHLEAVDDDDVDGLRIRLEEEQQRLAVFFSLICIQFSCKLFVD